MKKVLVFVAKEGREALPALIFFLLAFHMIELTKTALLGEYSISVTSSTIATATAIIVAKVILIIEKLPVSGFFTNRMLYNILWKTLLFGAATILLRVVEESIHQAIKHGEFASVIKHLTEGLSWPHFWIVQMWLFGLLFFYCLIADLARVIGVGKLRAMLMGPMGDAARA